MEKEQLHNNAEFIHNYTAEAVERINRSINIGTDKLTKVLAFSGVFLKLSGDMPSEGYLFTLKFLTMACLSLATGFCAAGLWTRGDSKTMPDPDWLLEEQYRLSEEEMHVMLTRSLVSAVPSLREIRDYRAGTLKAAIGLLTAAGFLYAAAQIVAIIH